MKKQGDRVVSVQCPFYVVLLVMMHKKQCNVKRALASNTICITLCSFQNNIQVQNHSLRPRGDLPNSCKMRLPLVCFSLLIVFYFLAKEGHWSFNDKCHQLCVRNDSAVWTSAKIPLSPLHSQIFLCFVKDLSTFRPWEFSSTQYKVIIVFKKPTFTEIYGIHPPCAGVLTPHWERTPPEVGKECLNAFYCDSASANYKE